MGLTLTGARWTQKPPPGTDLDRTHVLCPDHAWPFLSPQGTAQSLAKSARLADPSTRGDIYSGTSSLVAGRKYGLSVRHAATTDNLRLTSDTEFDKVVTLSGGWTILLCYRKTDSTLRPRFAFGPLAAPAGTEVQGLIPYSDGTVYFDFGGSVAGTTRLSVAGLTVGDDLWVFSTGVRGMEIWQNGLLRGSNSATPTRSANSTAFQCPPYVANGDLADYALVLTWRRQLPGAAIRALSINPWQIFQPRTVLVLAAPVAAAAATKLNTLLLAP